VRPQSAVVYLAPYWSLVMANILIEFADYPVEREIIGRLLIAYGELEWALAECLRVSMNSKMNEAIRILFRVRGEGPRIEVADAIARPAYIKIGLEGQWGNAIGAARVCKNIRNQYAHCHWRVLDDGLLRFINLDVEAETAAGAPLMADAIPLKLPLLQRQEDYFKYALDWLYYLGEEYKFREGKLSSQILEESKSIPAPPLYDRPKKVEPIPPDTKPDGS